MKKNQYLYCLLIIAVLLLLLSCTPREEKSTPVAVALTTPESIQSLETGVTSAAEEEAVAQVTKDYIVEFVLKTTAEGGKLGYIGVGGEIDGIANPDLVVHTGETVRLILINGDGMPHDLFLPDLDVKTDYVSKINEKTEIIFEVGNLESGSYVYYCTVPGHRQAGQEGKWIIAE